MSIDFIHRANVVFWDFDGVIKDSVQVKSDAFEQLFLPFGKVVAKKVKTHHEENGGMSRYDKLPIYLKFANQTSSSYLVNKYAEKFSQLVKLKVIGSPWVDGVMNYLQNNYKRQQFFLVTATPQQEIEYILSQLKIAKYFEQIIGSPTSKIEAIKFLLNRHKINSQNAVMVGDSSSDYEASMQNQLTFILRKTKFNKQLQESIDCQIIKDFIHE